MNEYSVQFLNGIIKYVTATDWKEAISEAVIEGRCSQFANLSIKRIMDEDGNAICNIDPILLTFEHVLSGTQAQVKA